jgi:hypothetical protein
VREQGLKGGAGEIGELKTIKEDLYDTLPPPSTIRRAPSRRLDGSSPVSSAAGRPSMYTTSLPADALTEAVNTVQRPSRILGGSTFARGGLALEEAESLLAAVGDA